MSVSVLKEKVRFTYEDYLLLPDDVLLRTFVEERGLGRVYFAPCDVILSEEDIVPPGIFFISKEREHIITESFWNCAVI